MITTGFYRHLFKSTVHQFYCCMTFLRWYKRIALYIPKFQEMVWKRSKSLLSSAFHLAHYYKGMLNLQTWYGSHTYRRIFLRHTAHIFHYSLEVYCISSEIKTQEWHTFTSFHKKWTNASRDTGAVRFPCMLKTTWSVCTYIMRTIYHKIFKLHNSIMLATHYHNCHYMLTTNKQY
jgi:hypothetical protein